MSKYRWALDLQLFSEDTGVEVVPAAGEQAEGGSSGVEGQAAAEPTEKAFASRLAAERAKLEREYTERYKDYDTHKAISDYFAETNGLDALTLKERVELERLQERAEQANVPPEVLRRLDELEGKAAKADQLEQFQQDQQGRVDFETKIKTFAEEKGADHTELWNFMHEHQIQNMEIAYKAMRADQLEQQLAGAEKAGMKKLLQAKGSIPTVSGSTAQGHVSAHAPKTFAEARARAMQRMSQNE